MDTATNLTGTMEVPVQQFINTFEEEHSIELVLTADGTAAAKSTVYLIPGVGDTSALSLPTGVTLSGDYSTVAELHAMLSNYGLLINRIEMQTTDTANYGYNLYFANRTPNKQNTREARVSLQQYREPVGTGYSDTLIIPEERAFVIQPNTYVKTELKQSTQISFRLFYKFVQSSGTFVPVDVTNKIVINP